MSGIKQRLFKINLTLFCRQHKNVKFVQVWILSFWFFTCFHFISCIHFLLLAWRLTPSILSVISLFRISNSFFSVCLIFLSSLSSALSLTHLSRLVLPLLTTAALYGLACFLLATPDILSGFSIVLLIPRLLLITEEGLAACLSKG